MKYVLVILLLVPVFLARAATYDDIDGDGYPNTVDVCPLLSNPKQDFAGVLGCRDSDYDRFEDTFFDHCPGYYGGNQGCPQEQYMQLLAVNGEIPGLTLLEACILPNTMVVPGDDIMLQLDAGTTGEVLSDPIRIE